MEYRLTPIEEPADDGDVLTLREAADILRVSITTAKIEAGKGRLPAFKVGKNWRITRGNLRRYMNGRAAS